MFPAENLRDWRGEKVIDPAGDKIGDLEAVYVDTATDEPAFLTVRVGFIGRHRLVFVPAAGATVLPDAVRVRYDRERRTAPGPALNATRRDARESRAGGPQGRSRAPARAGHPAGSSQ
jgi:hypothetical protein